MAGIQSLLASAFWLLARALRWAALASTGKSPSRACTAAAAASQTSSGYSPRTACRYHRCKEPLLCSIIDSRSTSSKGIVVSCLTLRCKACRAIPSMSGFSSHNLTSLCIHDRQLYWQRRCRFGACEPGSTNTGSLGSPCSAIPTCAAAVRTSFWPF